MKKSLLLLALVASFTLAGCGSNSSESYEAQDETTTTKESSEKYMEDCMMGCKILWESNENNKDKSQDDMDKDCTSLCKAGEGIENNDVSSCEKSDGILKDSCFSEIAQDTNNPEICEKVTDKTMLGGCYAGVAEKSKDASVCDKLSDEMWKGICLDNAKSDSE